MNKQEIVTLLGDNIPLPVYCHEGELWDSERVADSALNMIVVINDSPEGEVVLTRDGMQYLIEKVEVVEHESVEGAFVAVELAPLYQQG